MVELHGFIIAQKDWPDDQKLALGRRTFADSAAHAWRFHIGRRHDSRDYSTMVQRWHDKGYRPFRVCMKFDPPWPEPVIGGGDA